ncbi:MAG: excinuclease ABC subunit UvrC [Pseudomonadota bacterium]
MSRSEEKMAFDVKAFLKTLTNRPGVYKMLNVKGDVVYIGKAKNLKNRVSSYFRSRGAAPKQQVMLSHVAFIEVTVTHTEGEALLLENQLIKRYKPRYNICLRDDKSYPSIYVTTHQNFPRVTFHRGAKRKLGRYFGPYPSAGAVRESLKLLQKIFPVRQCEDATFNNRSRPCLQYQIERCTAPCVGLISEEEYKWDVDFTLMFLEGNGSLVIGELVKRMENASRDLDFEKAARYRDQIASLRIVLEKQFVNGERGDLDIIACASRAGVACVQVFFIRHGQHLGDKTFFPKMAEDHDPGSVLGAFIPQYYLGKHAPAEILVSHEVENPKLLGEVLAEQAKRNVAISSRVRGDRLRWLKMAETNAENALTGMLSNREGLYARFLSLRREMGLKEVPRRLECFDISHTQGEQTVASCVVFDREGPVKSAYRRFNIEDVIPGDDYAAMAQAITRRYKRMKKGEHECPDILFVDGGKGQVSAAQKVLKELEVEDVMIIGISKGPDRKPGMETLVLADGDRTLSVTPGATSALLLIQHIRDEAHRFAITGHRQRRGRAKKQSTLECIEGLGPKRRQTLLKQFGGLQGVSKAGVDALGSVEGISQQLAQRIYDTYHQQDN